MGPPWTPARGLLVAAAAVVAGHATVHPEAPLCGRGAPAARTVAEWQQGLQLVAALGPGAPEVVFHEPVAPLWRRKAHALRSSDYKLLKKKVKDPDKVQEDNWLHGVEEKVLVKLEDGWLFPNGLAFNKTHRFRLGTLNEGSCIENRHAMTVGRSHCNRTDWLTRDLLQRSGKTSPLKCAEVDSAIAFVQSIYDDFGTFHEVALPMVHWPQLQELTESAILWRFAAPFVRPWLKLLGLSKRKLKAIPPMGTLVKFKTLYVPLWVGLHDDQPDTTEIPAYAPASDLHELRRVALRAISSPPGRTLFPSVPVSARYALLLERGKAESTRRFTDTSARELRRLVVAEFGALGMQAVSVQGSPKGTFRVRHLADKAAASTDGVTLAESLRLWASADVVVGAHGGLLHHLMVAPHGAHVIEFITPGDPTPLTFYHTCSALGLHYHFLPVDGLHKGEFLNVDMASAEKLVAIVARSVQTHEGAGSHSAESRRAEL